jgi:hypothetical protein
LIQKGNFAHSYRENNFLRGDAMNRRRATRTSPSHRLVRKTPDEKPDARACAENKFPLLFQLASSMQNVV